MECVTIKIPTEVKKNILKELETMGVKVDFDEYINRDLKALWRRLAEFNLHCLSSY